MSRSSGRCSGRCSGCRCTTIRGMAAAWLLAPLLGAGPAAAEGFLELAAGAAFGQRGSMQLAAPGSVQRSVDYQTGPGLGLRGGYFLPGAARWLGFGGGVSWFRVEADDFFFPGATADFHAFPVTPQIILRLPLVTSEAYPNGQLQPYVAAGPGFFVSVVDTEIPGGDVDDVDFDVGPDVRTGLAVMLGPAIGAFVEYRYTDFDGDYDEDFGTSGSSTLRANIANHHAQAGVSFRF